MSGGRIGKKEKNRRGKKKEVIDDVFNHIFKRVKDRDDRGVFIMNRWRIDFIYGWMILF